jgi:hypothetical protein
MGQTVAQRQLKVLAACDKASRKTKLSKLVLTGDTGAVKARQRVEQTIALTAAQVLLDAGFSLGVDDGEEITLTHSRDIEAVKRALFTTDEDYLYVYEAGRNLNEKDTRPDGWVRLIYGNDGWDVISDYSSVDLLDKYLGDGTAVQKLIDKLADDYDPTLLFA